MADPEEDYERWDCPYKSLGDVGIYCYCSLCAVALSKLFDQRPHDKAFVRQCLENLCKHLSVPEPVLQSTLALSENVDIDSERPFIDSLKTDDIVKKEGVNMIPKDLILIALSDGGYDSRMRTLIKYIGLVLMMDCEDIEKYEEFIIQTYREQEHQMTEEEKKETESKQRSRKIKKYTLIGLATVGGGALLGLTGGLAAPLIAGAVGAVVGGTAAGFLGTTAGIAIMGSLFGAAGAGLGGYKMKKRVGDIEEFQFEPLSESSQLHVTIAVTGWITADNPDFCQPWRGLANSKEQYSLRYESKYLKEMGQALDYLWAAAVSQATSQALRYTVLSGLMAAIAWPATIIAVANVIDNPWSVMTQRTIAAGKQLAEVLLSRQQGRRPVTLIGYSLGARVIFYCLKEMAQRKNCEGIVEDAIMLGAPVTADVAEWQKLTRVVAGRLVNGYCRGDWILKFLYRTASVQMNIAGLQPVHLQDRRMQNYDLSELVEGHLDYHRCIDEILDILNVRTQARPPESKAAQSLQQWVAANRQRSASHREIPSSRSTPQLGASAKQGTMKGSITLGAMAGNKVGTSEGKKDGERAVSTDDKQTEACTEEGESRQNSETQEGEKCDAHFDKALAASTVKQQEVVKETKDGKAHDICETTVEKKSTTIPVPSQSTESHSNDSAILNKEENTANISSPTSEKEEVTENMPKVASKNNNEKVPSATENPGRSDTVTSEKRHTEENVEIELEDDGPTDASSRSEGDNKEHTVAASEEACEEKEVSETTQKLAKVSVNDESVVADANANVKALCSSDGTLVSDESQME